MNTPKQIRWLTVLILLSFILTIGWRSPTSLQVSLKQANFSVIIRGDSIPEMVDTLKTCGGALTSELDIIHAIGANVTEQVKTCMLRTNPSLSFFLNGQVSLTKDETLTKKIKIPETDYPDTIGADLVWEENITGEGVTVAVVDTGILLDNHIVRDTKYKNRITGWIDYVDKSKIPIDPNGHGTHVAGIILNSEIGADGEWNGIAPSAKLVGVRVLDKKGAGTYERVIQGIQWVINNKDKYNIRVMNLSISAPVQSPYWADPLNLAVTRAWAEGIIVVVAAGNTGPGPMSIGVPGNNPYVITVGAFTDNFTPLDWNDDYITPFSSAGPTLDGFVKPDLVAPGAHMVSLMARNSYIARQHEANWISNRYFSMAGTSQAAAVVSGVSALILANQPDLTPEQVKYRLMITAMPWVNPEDLSALYSIWQQGAGRLNAPDAVFSDIVGEANANMDIWADLAGDIHYEGYTSYNPETGEFYLVDEQDLLPEAYGLWSGAYGIWSGGYGSWIDAYGLWSGAYGIWSGSFNVSTEAYGLWSGAYGLWSGAYGIWSGGFSAWTGSEPWAETEYASQAFVTNFLLGKSPDITKTKAALGIWVEEP